MAEVEEPAYVAETLQWCNSIREDKGMEPLDKLPKGKISDGYSCPCGAATGMFVGRSHFMEAQEHRLGETLFERGSGLPTAVKHFVRAFDAGRLPQYIEGAGFAPDHQHE